VGEFCPVLTHRSTVMEVGKGRRMKKALQGRRSLGACLYIPV